MFIRIGSKIFSELSGFINNSDLLLVAHIAIFAATYALFCGVLLIVTTGIILAPVVHRVLHALHADDADDDGGNES